MRSWWRTWRDTCIGSTSRRASSSRVTRPTAIELRTHRSARMRACSCKPMPVGSSRSRADLRRLPSLKQARPIGCDSCEGHYLASFAPFAMLPVIALVGRPNVGKSTLFNVLTGTRDALVADMPGLTRDRKYGFGKIGPVPYLVVDTGGLVAGAEGIEALMARQTLRAIEEADRVLFLVDVREGLTPSDSHVAQTLRKLGKQVILVANKAEGLDAATAGAEFYQLGLGEPQAISSAHGDGVRALMERVLEGFEAPPVDEAAPADDIRVAVIGRPNVGKSTLINRLLGEDRVIA